jgi:hypothetical protein
MKEEDKEMMKNEENDGALLRSVDMENLMVYFSSKKSND